MDYQTRNEAIVKDYASGLTMRETGLKHGISRERVRQILNELGHTDRNPRIGAREKFTCSGCGKSFMMRPSQIKRGTDRERKYHSPECYAKHQHTYSREDLITHMRRLAKELGRTPTQQDIQDAAPPSHTTFYAHFGSMTAAQEAAGLEARTHGGPR